MGYNSYLARDFSQAKLYIETCNSANSEKLIERIEAAQKWDGIYEYKYYQSSFSQFITNLFVERMGHNITINSLSQTVKIDSRIELVTISYDEVVKNDGRCFSSPDDSSEYEKIKINGDTLVITSYSGDFRSFTSGYYKRIADISPEKNYILPEISELEKSVVENDSNTSDDEFLNEFQSDLDSVGDELRQENDTGNYSNNDEAIWQYCQNRWDYYDALEGGYSGDKYTEQVFIDAGNKFGISATEARRIWDKVDKEKLGI